MSRSAWGESFQAASEAFDIDRENDDVAVVLAKLYSEGNGVQADISCNSITVGPFCMPGGGQWRSFQLQFIQA